MDSTVPRPVIAAVATGGALFYTWRAVRKWWKQQQQQPTRHESGVLWAAGVYAKTATGGAAVLLGSACWAVLPRGLVPLPVAAAACCLPFASYLWKSHKTLLTAGNNREYGVGLLVGCALAGYCFGPVAVAMKRFRVLLPFVAVYGSTLAGHAVAALGAEDALDALLNCAPASLCFCTLAIGSTPTEPVLQAQVLVSALLVPHTWWAVELGDPSSFDTNTHALGLLGVGLYTVWSVVRALSRAVALPFLACTPENHRATSRKHIKLVTEAVSGCVMAAGYLWLLAVVRERGDNGSGRLAVK